MVRIIEGIQIPGGPIFGSPVGRRRIRVGGLDARLSGVVVAAMVVASLVAPGKAMSQGFGGGGGRGGPGAQTEVKLVDRFDTDADGRLNTTERAAARVWLAENGGAAGGFPGGQAAGPPPGMRGGGPGAPPIGGPGALPPGGPGGPPPGGPGGFGGRGGGGGGGGRGGGGARLVTGAPGPRVTPAEVQSFAGVDLYDTATLRTIFLEFESPEWEKEVAAFYNTDVEVPATAMVDGKTYPGVGVHYRGMSSFRMIPEGSKRSLNLAFDFVDEDQRLEGYRTLNLLNANSDPTFVRTVLYSQIARDYGAAPKANFVRVVINGEYWGVYINLQQYNKDFLDDFFDTDDGARWKVPGSPNGRAGLEYLGDDPAAYKRLYEIKTKDDDASWQALINLARVLNQTPPEQLEAALAPILDIDGTLKFLAVENVLVNTDGYWTRASDYSIYQDPDGRFHIIPHDMNEGLGTGGNVQLDPLAAANDATKPLISKLLAVPALRERYLGYVREVATKWLDWSVLQPLVNQHQAVIDDAVTADTRKLYGTPEFTTGVESLRQFVEQRRAFLLR